MLCQYLSPFPLTLLYILSFGVVGKPAIITPKVISPPGKLQSLTGGELLQLLQTDQASKCFPSSLPSCDSCWFYLISLEDLLVFSVMPYTILDIKKIFILLLFLYRGYRYPLYKKKKNNSDLIVLHNTSSLKKSEGLNLSLSFLKAQF